MKMETLLSTLTPRFPLPQIPMVRMVLPRPKNNLHEIPQTKKIMKSKERRTI
jgi:hypothetical protein